MKTIETFLPLFPGFYNTLFEPDIDSGIYRKIDSGIGDINLDLDPDDFDFDNIKYEHDASKAITHLTETFLQDYIRLSKDNVEFEFKELRSPRQYNFENDRIFINVKIKNYSKFCNWLKAKIQTGDVWVDEYLQGHFTERSGFMPFYPNNLKDWKKLTDNFSDFSDFNTLGVLLDALSQNRGDEYDSEVVECLNKNLPISEYLTVEGK